MKKKPVKLTPGRMLAVGFLGIILAGALLLSLPFANRTGRPLPFLDCLFTSTSATCVTGLVAADTWTQFNGLGQLILLLLIQVGGLGYMTMVLMASMLLGRKISLRQRDLMLESVSAERLSDVYILLRYILCGTAAIECAGAALLAVRFVPELGLGRGTWYAVFHSISAFCNAGFDLMGPYSGAYSSFTAYAGDPLVSLTICALILFGGTGFLVWEDLVHNKYHWRRYRLQTKVVLTVNLVLTLGGGALFFLLERNNLGAGRPLGEQVLSALFDAVTPRTAGFNSTDTGALTSGSLLLTIIFMFIGGSPGSTAGGVKTTTVFVILLHALSGVRRERSANAFGRSIGDDALKKATAVLYTNLLLALTGAVAICAIQPLGLTEVLFETFSAIGTAGMTMGITRDLLPLSRLIIIFLMYCGRVGSISFAVALLEKRALPPVTLPREDITIG